MIIQEVFPSKNPKIWKAIVNMDALCFPEDNVHLPNKGYWFIAYDENDGMMGYAGLDNHIEKHIGFLRRCGVLSKYIGQGLQKVFINERLLKAQEIGYKSVITSTCQNPYSSNNLIDCGFKMYEPDVPWGIDGTCYWKKELI